MRVIHSPEQALHSPRMFLSRGRVKPNEERPERAERLLAAALVLPGCGKPLPTERSAFVGNWSSPTMSLHITQDGRVEYRRVKGGVTTSVSGPLQKFEGDDFHVGIAMLSTRFAVAKAPAQENGAWTMVVDGELLTRR